MSATVPRRDDVMHLGPIVGPAESAYPTVAFAHELALTPPGSDVGMGHAAPPQNRSLPRLLSGLPHPVARRRTDGLLVAGIGLERPPAPPTVFRDTAASAPAPRPVALGRAVPHVALVPGPVVRDAADGTVAVGTVGWWHDSIIPPREAEYVAIAEARLNGTQRGMALA